MSIDRMSSGEVWQCLNNPGAVFLVLEASRPVADGVQHVKLAYLSFDTQPDFVGRVRERNLLADGHRRIA